MRLPVPADLRSLLSSGLNKSLGALLIKLATAALTYLTYVVLSRTMSGLDYGNFAIGLSLATVLSIVALLGQQTLVLRLWPEAMLKGDGAAAVEAVRAGSALTIVASVGLGALLIGGALLIDAMRPQADGVLHVVAAAALVLPLALAEFQSSALRAQGSLWTALAPRDLLWRSVLPLVVVLLAIAGIVLDGAQALVLSAALLLLALLLQGAMASARHRPLAPRFAGIGTFWARHADVSRWLLYGAIISTVALNIDTLVVGLLVDEASAGIYFNAARTAGLMTLFTYAATLVVAPRLARFFSEGDMRKAQAITMVSAWSGFAFSVLAFLCFLVFGRQLLAIFGPSYTGGWAILIILSIGLLIDAATGSSPAAMMMTGHERAYVAISGTGTLLGLMAQIAIIPVYGIVGAALVNMVVRILTQMSCGWWCIARIGLDATIFGVFRINRVGTGARA